MKANAFKFFLLFTFLVQSIPYAQEKPPAWGQIARSEILKRRYKTKPQETTKEHAAKPKVTPRIIGGSTSQPNVYPWMAAIVGSSSSDIATGQFCGGTLVHPHWIVTAAHCVIGSTPDSLDVVLGAHNLNQPVNIQRIEVSEIIVHPNYLDSGFTLNFDIALLRLKQPADERFTVLPLIDDAALENTGIIARTMGWGTTSAQQNISPTALQEADIPLVALSTANATQANRQTLTNQMLAAGFAEGGIDSCQGDSGGPLMVPYPLPPHWALAGVVSFGTGCAEPNTYGLYTKVSVFRDFVLEHISPNYQQWEKEQSIIGESRDPDDDGFTNFAEFAFQTRSERADQPQLFYSPQEKDGAMQQGLQFRRAKSADGVTYKIIQNSSLTPEGEMTYGLDDLETTNQDIAEEPLAVDSTVILPLAASQPRSFFRISAEPARKSVVGPRRLNAPGGASGNLVSDDLMYPDNSNRRQKLYQLTGLNAGENVSLFGRSRAFDVVLELLDADTLEILQTANTNSAVGILSTDESLTFTPSADTHYLLRLTSQSADELGFFELGCRATTITLPELTLGNSLSGTLSNSDTPNANRLPNTFREDRYLFNTGDTTGTLEVQAESSAFDIRITVTSAESGRVVVFNDDISENERNSRARFCPIPGSSYIIHVSSFSPNRTGTYQLSLVSLTQTLPTLTSQQSLSASLSTSDERDPDFGNAYRDDYALANIPVGATITVRMNSNSFETFLTVVDAKTGTLIVFGNSIPGTSNSEATFTVQAGIGYLIRASSFEDNITGAYSISID